MNKMIIAGTLAILLSACTSLTHQEKNTLRNLKAQGITVEKPVGNWDAPANPVGAGSLNLLPGFGNFYLASGNGADNSQYLYGFLNLITWPISILWGIPEAAVDANRINERELIYFYTFEESGKEALAQKGYKITPTGLLSPVK